MKRKKINLALQGGGAHGAFTWGVIDALLEDGRLDVEAVSGTSAGAMNAAVFADGMARGGSDFTRSHLRQFWREIADDGQFSPLQRTMFDRAIGHWNLDNSPGFIWLDMMSRFWSPYDFNPLNINPLKSLLDDFIDFEKVRSCEKLQLFISATNVLTGRLRVFPRDKVTADVIMASACLPLVFQAVEIDGMPYWDGGYMGNPALFPFFKSTTTEDILIIQINPVERTDTPRSARDIFDRINEITFNSSLVDEYRAIEFVSRLIDQGSLPHGMGEGQYRQMKMHRILATDHTAGLSASSRFNTEWSFFEFLFKAGRKAFKHFMRHHEQDIGIRSSFNVRTEVPAEWA